MMCPKSYQYHYLEKIRPTVSSAALAFGTAIDNGLNALLKGHTEPGLAEDVFVNTFFRQDVNGKQNVFIPTCEDLVYAAADFDADLLTKDSYSFIEKQIENGTIQRPTDYLEAYNIIRDKKKRNGFDNLSVEEKRYFNLLNWLSLRTKGLLMIATYRSKVLPLITKVHAIQEYVELTNDAGDKVIGYVDLIADVKGHGAVILDNKTSASDYEADSVLTSSQLALYTHILESKYKTRKAGYIVLKKGVFKNKVKICKSCGNDGSGARHKTCNATVDGKRCGGEWDETIDPEIGVQIIIDEIPKQTENIVLENIDGINEGIKAGVFHRNLNSCSNWYGSPCPYIKLCYKGSMHGLMKKDGGL
jgi:hypothetical protein